LGLGVFAGNVGDRVEKEVLGFDITVLLVSCDSSSAIKRMDEPMHHTRCLV
jgi:hypothetical protein